MVRDLIHYISEPARNVYILLAVVRVKKLLMAVHIILGHYLNSSVTQLIPALKWSCFSAPALAKRRTLSPHLVSSWLSGCHLCQLVRLGGGLHEAKLD